MNTKPIILVISLVVIAVILTFDLFTKYMAINSVCNTGRGDKALVPSDAYNELLEEYDGRVTKEFIDEIRKRCTVIDPYFQFTLTLNRGAIFGLFSDYEPEWVKQLFLTVMTSIALIVIIIFYRSLPADFNLSRIFLSLIVGGALGNFTDRVFGVYLYTDAETYHFYGAVVDFIDWRLSDEARWYLFNVADAAIVCGAVPLMIVMIIEAIKDMKEGKKNKK